MSKEQNLENKDKALHIGGVSGSLFGFKFRYRGEPKCWLVGNGEYVDLIERDFGLLEDEWHCGYVTIY